MHRALRVKIASHVASVKSVCVNCASLWMLSLLPLPLPLPLLQPQPQPQPLKSARPVRHGKNVLHVHHVKNVNHVPNKRLPLLKKS
ncbi:hypothetical protein D3C76_1628240 [compost metagenome]